MWRVPVGSFFEAVIDWLKDNVSIVFELIDTVLEFAIRALEQILLLNHAAIYPSVIITLLAGIIGYFLLPKASRGIRLGLAGGALVLLGGLEIWRYQTLEAEFSTTEAAALASDLENYKTSLEAAAPADYDRLQTILTEAKSVAPDNNRFVRHIRRIEGRAERLRPGEYEDARELAAEVTEVFEDDRIAVEMPKALRTSVDETEEFYRALSGIVKSQRLVRRLERQDAPQNRYGVLNLRTYEDTIAYLDASLANARQLGISEETVADWKELRDRIAALDPTKLQFYPAVILIVLLSALAYMAGGIGPTVFSIVGFLLIVSMGYWVATMETLALVMAATFFALLVGIPAGIWSARSAIANQAIRPVLDFMQTMPAFVYLIPAVLFFGLGRVPGAIATLIFAMPPAVRLTALGIRQVPKEVVEAAQAFGATPRQLLFKAQLPIAMPTILAGLNQTIMLALSMVVIGGMIGAGGLGAQVLIGITQMKIDVGFESGVAVVILAIFLDRITQRLGGMSGH